MIGFYPFNFRPQCFDLTLNLNQFLLILQGLLTGDQSLGKKLIVDADLLRSDRRLLSKLLNFPLSVRLVTRQRLHLELGALFAQQEIASPLRFCFLHCRTGQANLFLHLSA